MRVAVIRKFRDIHTQKIHVEGEEFTCSKARFIEICKKLPGFVEECIEQNMLSDIRASGDTASDADDFGGVSDGA
jgi:hypothetical protein